MNLKNVLWVGSWLCTTALNAQQVSFTMTVTDELAKPTDKAFLCYAAGGKFHVDSVAMVDGKFRIEATAPISLRASLYVSPGNSDFYRNSMKGQATNVYLQNGDILVHQGKTLSDIKIGGTSLNDDYQVYYETITPYKEREAMMEEEFQKAKSTEDNAAMERLQKEYQNMSVLKAEAEKAFFNKHLDSEVALDWLSYSVDVSNNKSEAQAMFNSMSERVRNTTQGKRYAAKLGQVKSVEVGNEAPDFTCNDANGDEISLKDFRGKYVLVDFWASWCGPCRRENPNVVKAYERFKSDKFEILGVSLDNQKGSWVDAIQKDGLTWPQVSSLMGWQSPVVGLYAVRAVPANFLIDPDGKIIARDLRGEELEKKLSEILK